MAELLGRAREEIAGCDVREFLPDPADAAALLQSGRERAERARELHRLNLRSASGDIRTALVRTSPLTEPNPQSADGSDGESEDPSPTLAMVTDLTDQLRAEEELQRLNRELEARVDARTEELASANRRLSESVAEMEAFTYSVSHDLRGPLRALDGFSQAVLEDYGDQLDDSGRDYLNRIRAAAQRLGSLMDDLLALSRVGRKSVRYESVDLGALARRTMDGLRDMHPERQVELTVHPELEVRASPNLMAILLENLLANAVKFTRGREPARIELMRLEPDDWPGEAPDGSAFAVRDNGVGFDPEFTDQLFLPFQRLHPPSEFRGNGVGLATVRRIVEKHGGQVAARGKPDRGATFYFSIPARPPDDGQDD